MNAEQILKEVVFKAVRSSGAGGQHVNKVATKVILLFDIEGSEGLSPEEKDQLYKALGSRLSKNNILIVQAANTRSQIKNREIAQEKLIDLLSNSLQLPKPRKKTKPTRASKEKRLKSKHIKSVRKRDRKRPDLD